MHDREAVLNDDNTVIVVPGNEYAGFVPVGIIKGDFCARRFNNDSLLSVNNIPTEVNKTWQAW